MLSGQRCFFMLHAGMPSALASGATQPWGRPCAMPPHHCFPLPPVQTGVGGSQTLLPHALQLLPASLVQLELDSFITAYVPAALARFTRLQRLSLSGNAWEVEWAQLPAQALLPLLHELRLLYNDLVPPATHVIDMMPITRALPDATAAALAAATRLVRLDIQVEWWSDSVVHLCLALPALRELRWVLHVLLQQQANGGA